MFVRAYCFGFATAAALVAVALVASMRDLDHVKRGDR